MKARSDASRQKSKFVIFYAKLRFTLLVSLCSFLVNLRETINWSLDPKGYKNEN